MSGRYGPGALAGAAEAENDIAGSDGRCHIRPAALAQDPRPYKPPSARPAIVAADWRPVKRKFPEGILSASAPFRAPFCAMACCMSWAAGAGSAVLVDLQSTGTAGIGSTSAASGSIRRASRSRIARPETASRRRRWLRSTACSPGRRSATRARPGAPTVSRRGGRPLGTLPVRPNSLPDHPVSDLWPR